MREVCLYWSATGVGVPLNSIIQERMQPLLHNVSRVSCSTSNRVTLGLIIERVLFAWLFECNNFRYFVNPLYLLLHILLKYLKILTWWTNSVAGFAKNYFRNDSRFMIPSPPPPPFVDLCNNWFPRHSWKPKRYELPYASTNFGYCKLFT